MDTTAKEEITTQVSLNCCKDIDNSSKFSSLSRIGSDDTLNTNCYKSEFVENFPSVEKVSDGEEFQDATQFFRNDQQLEYLENIRTSNENSWLSRDSLGRNFDPLFKNYGQPLDLRPVVESETALFPASLPDVIVTVAPKDESLELEEDSSNNLVDKNLSIVNGPILLPTRESIGNLIKFDSPVKKRPIDYFEFPITSDPVLYTEGQLNKLLKLQELQFEEACLRKQRVLESERVKILNEKDNAIELLNLMVSCLYLVLQNVTILVQNLYEQRNETLKEKFELLQILLQKEIDDLKAAAQDFTNYNEFSNFQKSYDLAKELLKIYKSNENKLLMGVKTLQERLLTLEEQYKCLQRVSGKLEETYAEDPNSTNDSQLSVFQALVESSNLKEEYLENRLKQARDENGQLKNIVEDLKSKIDGI